MVLVLWGFWFMGFIFHPRWLARLAGTSGHARQVLRFLDGKLGSWVLSSGWLRWLWGT